MAKDEYSRFVKNVRKKCQFWEPHTVNLHAEFICGVPTKSYLPDKRNKCLSPDNKTFGNNNCQIYNCPKWENEDMCSICGNAIKIFKFWNKCICGNTWLTHDHTWDKTKGHRFRTKCDKCGLKTKWYKTPRICNINWKRIQNENNTNKRKE